MMENGSIKPLRDLIDIIRDIDGFPISSNEDIIELSNPPYYTACPNPYIKKFVEEYGKPYDLKKDDYNKKPFLRDVYKGKNEIVYNLHSYPTKVPPKAIENYISHYTDIGDIVIDSYCGTGMTGIAATRKDRNCILIDLSPLAAFIAYNLTNSFNKKYFSEKIKEIFKEVKNECGWMLKTKHVGDPTVGNHKFKRLVNNKSDYGEIIYTVWSNMYICPYCGYEFVLWKIA